MTYWPSNKYTTEDCVFKCLDLLFVVFICDLISVSIHLDSATYAILKDIHIVLWFQCGLTHPLWALPPFILPPYSERNDSSQRKRPSMSNVARYTQRKDKCCLFLLRSKTKDKVGVMLVLPKYYDYFQAPPAGPYAGPVKPIPYSHIFFCFLWLLLIITCFHACVLLVTNRICANPKP